MDIANEIIANSDIFGVVLPLIISTGVFVHVAGDNNDTYQDTIVGKRITHATTLVLIYRSMALHQSSALGTHSGRMCNT